MITNWSATFLSFSIYSSFQKGNRKMVAEKSNYNIYCTSSHQLQSLTNTLVFCPRDLKHTVKLTKLLSGTALVKILN